SDRRRHRHLDRGAVPQDRAAAAGGLPSAQGRGGHQHGGEHAVGPVLWRDRDDRRHPGTRDREARAGDQGDRDRRAGAPDRQRLEVSQDGGRASYARRPPNDMGTEPASLNYYNYFTEV